MTIGYMRVFIIVIVPRFLGYYRVAYDRTNYRLIADQLIADHRRISLMNRAQLLDDAFTLAKVNKISYNESMDLTLYLKYEREYVPWRAVLDELNYIDVMLYNDAQHVDWKVAYTSLLRCLPWNWVVISSNHFMKSRNT